MTTDGCDPVIEREPVLVQEAWTLEMRPEVKWVEKAKLKKKHLMKLSSARECCDSYSQSCRGATREAERSD